MADAGVVHIFRKIAGHGLLSTTQRYLHPNHDAVLGDGELLTNYLRGATADRRSERCSEPPPPSTEEA
ncbi:hypothetical protein GCM10023204_52140 [Actinomycetospora succinea]